MKRSFSVAALVVTAAMLASCKGGEASQTTGAVDEGGAGSAVTTTLTSVTQKEKKRAEVIYDEIFYNKEQNAEFAIMRVGDRYITYSKNRTGWIDMYSYNDFPEEIKLEDGEFGLVKADITRVSGGVAGYGGDPQIDRLISFSPMTLEEAAEYAGIEKYDPEDIYCVAPHKYREYLIIYSYPEYRVYSNGELVGAYENIILAQGAMGFNDIDSEGIEIEDYGSCFVYVMRIGNIYYGYQTSMFANRYFTPLLDSNLDYISSEFDLKDGETVRVNCNYSSVNGGKQGFVNAPIIRNIYKVEGNDYDSLTRLGITPLSEQTDELEDHADGGAEVLFERNGKTWLVFRINGVYHVYADDYSKIKKYGEFDSLDAVKNVVYGDKSPEKSDDIGEMYYSEPSPEEILTDPETGIQYAKNQLLISAAPEAEKSEMERIIKELDAETIGYIRITNDYQIRFFHDMTINDLQKAADHLNSFPFIYNVTLNICSETSFE